MARTTPQPNSSSSPLKFPASSGFEAGTQKLDELRLKMNRSMTGLFVGPMPVAQFLEDFLPPLPPAAPAVPELPKHHFNDMPKVRLERDMYQPFIDHIHDYSLIPGYKIIDTGDYPDHDMGGSNKIRPDPTMYKNALDTTEKVTQFGELELHFELKPDSYSDPFDDPDSPKVDRLAYRIEASGIQRSRARSQLIHYASEWCTRQHRRFAFTIFVGDPYVRFIRWDRAGAVVSEKFDYRENSRPLVEFLWRFTHANDAGRGIDPTVRRATDKEAKLARLHLSEWAPKAERPFNVFKVTGDDGEPREFIAWGSMENAGSLTGRCTRAYPVYEEATKKRYFLKDTWRARDLGQEADILRKLQAANVQHIPPFVCGGDLLDDVTETDLYVADEDVEDQGEDKEDLGAQHGMPSLSVGRRIAKKRDGSWRCGRFWGRITQRFHHRFIVDFIGKHIETFSSSKQLLQVVSDAFTAHRQAYENCQILHRDISSRNILIDDSGRGVLNDWDLAKHKSELEQARRHERTGTWEFMSCLLLTEHHKIHTIQDDMESFIHIVLYHSLRYFPHNKAPSTLRLLKAIFNDETIDGDGTRVGGDNKKTMFRDAKYLGRGFKFTTEPLHVWMMGVFRAAKQWIDYQDPAEGDDRYLIMASGEAATDAPAAVSDAQLPAAPDPSAHLHFKDHAWMATTFLHCLSSLEWPLEDAPVDALPALRLQASSNKHLLGSVDTDEDGSVGGSRKRSKTSQSRGRGSGFGSSGSSLLGHSLGSGSSHSMSTRLRTQRNGVGGSLPA